MKSNNKQNLPMSESTSSNLVSQRTAMLANLALNKDSFGLPIDEMVKMDAILRDDWDIDLVETNLQLDEYAKQYIDSPIKEQLLLAYHEVDPEFGTGV
jgi:hypothetical protein